MVSQVADCSCGVENTGAWNPSDGRVIITSLRSDIPRIPTYVLKRLNDHGSKPS